jgi:hypothetical protein
MPSLGVNIDHIAKVFTLPYEGGEQLRELSLQPATVVHTGSHDSHCGCNAFAPFASNKHPS